MATYSKLSEYTYSFLNTKTYLQIQNGDFYIQCTATINASASLTINSINKKTASVTIASTSTLTSQGVICFLGSVTINSSTNLSVDSVNKLLQSMQIDSLSELNSEGIKIISASVEFNSITSFDTSPILIEYADLGISSSSKLINLPLNYDDILSYETLNSYSYYDLQIGRLIKNLIENVSFDSLSTFDLEAYNNISADCTMASTSTFTADCIVYRSASIEINCTSSLDAVGNTIKTADISIAAEGDLINLPLKYKSKISYETLENYTYNELQAGKIQLSIVLNTEFISHSEFNTEATLIKYSYLSIDSNFTFTAKGKLIKKYQKKITAKIEINKKYYCKVVY